MDPVMKAFANKRLGNTYIYLNKRILNFLTKFQPFLTRTMKEGKRVVFFYTNVVATYCLDGNLPKLMTIIRKYHFKCWTKFI